MKVSHTHKQIIKSFSIVMGAVLLSRVLGFAREWMVAHQLGSNAGTDAYYAAFVLPDFMTYLVAGGSLELFFIPVFTKYLVDNHEDEAWHVFSTVVTFIILALVPMIILGEIFAPQLVRFTAPGFSAGGKAQVVYLTRIMLPAQLFFCVGIVLIAVQNARTRFLVPALAGVVYNVAVILGGWFLSPRLGAAGFAIGLVAGIFGGYFILQTWAVARAGGHFHLSFDFRHPGFLMFLKLAIPIMLAVSLVASDEWLLRWFASYLQPASITWLAYSKTLMRVPLATIGNAVGVASYPFLAKFYSEGNTEELNQMINHTFRGIVLILAPISTLTVVFHLPIVSLVFSRTRMTAFDIHATASTLVFFAVGMIAWGLQNLVSRAFYATRDSTTPAVVGTAFTILNLPVYALLARHWQSRGLAAASSIGIIAYTAVIFALLARRTDNHEAFGLLRFLSKTVVACAVCGLACYRLSLWMGTRVTQNALGSLKIVLLVSTIFMGMLFLLTRVFRIREVDSYWRKLTTQTEGRVVPS
jgi:putative peptidoglycan lipid II flippase